MYDMDIERYSRFKHQPIAGPRKGFNGEEIFTAAWQKMHQGSESRMPGEAFSEIFSHTGLRLVQDDASTAASFICWLGTRGGVDFLTEARNLKINSKAQRPYLMAWANENVRVPWQNSGKRAIEHILSSGAVPNPKVTLRHFEIVEALTIWLSSEEGEAFIELCEAEVELKKSNEQFENYLKNNCQLTVSQVTQILNMARNYKG